MHEYCSKSISELFIDKNIDNNNILEIINLHLALQIIYI